MADETHVEFVPVQEDEVDTTDRCSDIYANVVDVGGTLSDMHIQFSLIDRPQCRVHLSFTTAKYSLRSGSLPQKYSRCIRGSDGTFNNHHGGSQERIKQGDAG